MTKWIQQVCPQDSICRIAWGIAPCTQERPKTKANIQTSAKSALQREVQRACYNVVRAIHQLEGLNGRTQHCASNRELTLECVMPVYRQLLHLRKVLLVPSVLLCLRGTEKQAADVEKLPHTPNGEVSRVCPRTSASCEEHRPGRSPVLQPHLLQSPVSHRHYAGSDPRVIHAEAGHTLGVGFGACNQAACFAELVNQTVHRVEMTSMPTNAGIVQSTCSTHGFVDIGEIHHNCSYLPNSEKRRGISFLLLKMGSAMCQ
jgi:hypothetical protein